MRKFASIIPILAATLIIVSLTAIIGTLVALRAETQQFNPIRKLTTWYTDRTPIDIEIVGSSSMLPEFHHLEPERTLKFRLERAYVDFLISESEPGFEIVDLSFDIDTGLPTSLFHAVASRGKFHENIENVPVLSNEELARRTLLVSIRSASSATQLRQASDRNRKCTGAPIGNGLKIFDWKDQREWWKDPPPCFPPTYPHAMLYVADYDAELALQMQCREAAIGCSMHFPFKGFAIELDFHHDHLRDWRMMIDRASEFLLSKEYH